MTAKHTLSSKLKTVNFNDTQVFDLNTAASAELPYVNSPEYIDYVEYHFKHGLIDNKRLTKGNGLNIIVKKDRVKASKFMPPLISLKLIKKIKIVQYMASQHFFYLLNYASLAINIKIKRSKDPIHWLWI